MNTASTPLCGSRSLLCFVAFLCALFPLMACGEAEGPIVVAEPDRAQFEAAVVPVLLRDCASSACHGSQERFFQVLGPGRTRLYREQRAADPILPEEVDFNYQRARSMLDAADPSQSLLLRKPLAVKAGGAGHLGVDGFGRDVYQFEGDPLFQVLSAWASGQGGAPAANPNMQQAPPMQEAAP